MALDKATEILKIVWSKTNHILFSRKREEELKKEYKLPFDKKPPNGYGITYHQT